MSLVCDIFKSYYDARINKRNTISQLEFEFDLERNLLHLYQELQNNRYEIGPSIFFIQTHPVKREIFAGAFRDRIVHHLIYNYLNPLCEKTFIYDSYSCRVDKGTSKGVQRMSTFIRSCSQNYTKDCYILKLDIQGYFMSIHKDILYHSIQSLIDQKISLLKIPMTTEWLLQLIHKVIYHDCTQNGIFKGKKTDYEGLPLTKSLFYSKPNCGLPIGNLTSQLFSNIYLHEFDVYMKHTLKLPYYGRYVDDFVIIHHDKAYLQSLIPQITLYLQSHLALTLHPRKIYLQHYSKGVLFLGTVIKPYRTYIRKRTLGYFYQKIQLLNQSLLAVEQETNPIIQAEILNGLKKNFVGVMNAYLGFLRPTKSYKKRKQMIDKHVNPKFWEYVSLDEAYTKAKLKK